VSTFSRIYSKEEFQFAVGRLSKTSPRAKGVYEASQEEFQLALARYYQAHLFDDCMTTKGGRDQIMDIVMAQVCHPESPIPLHLASCLNGDKKLVEEIINGGADPNAVDNNGATALFMHCAGGKGNPALVQLLLVFITVPTHARLVSALFSS
jgi:hypothetical protein